MLFALGYKRQEILDLFYDFKTFTFDSNKNTWKSKFDFNDYKRPLKLKDDLVDAATGKKFLKKGSKINFAIAKKLYEDGLKNVSVASDYFLKKYLKKDIIDNSSNKIILGNVSSS